MSREHAFTAVDAQPDPAQCVAVLDRLRREPAYAGYKARAIELLAPESGRRYLDIGTGTGADALAFARRCAVEVAGIDASKTMIEEARRRGLKAALVADAERLPFDDGTFDGCWADRTFQHLAHPTVALAEMVRVTKAGGRIVVVDPDYDTQVIDVPDQVLARRVLRFRADHLLRNGTLAHRMAGLFGEAGLGEIHVEPAVVVLRDPTALDNAMGLRSWARTAAERGALSGDEADSWERMLDGAIAAGRFLYSFSLFMTAGRRSPAS